MGYIQQIKRLNQEDNLGSIVEISICRKADIITIPTPVGRTIYGAITLQPGAGFISWQVTTARMNSAAKNTKDGNAKNNTLSITIPKDRSDLRQMFSIMEEDEFVVIYTENGKQKLFGLTQAPALFSFSHDTGGDIADKNQYTCRFFYEGPDNIYFYEGSITVAPAGPAPAVIKFGSTPETAVAIASLTPGQTLVILSDYSYTEYFTTT